MILRDTAGPFVVHLQGFHLLWRCFPDSFDLNARSRYAGPTTPTEPRLCRFGLVPFRSPLLRESLLFSLPPGTEMFQFPGFASRKSGMTGLRPAGFPHSEICGSRFVCNFPQLIAAYHVLRRLLMPRHPPYALTYLYRHDFDHIGIAVIQTLRRIMHLHDPSRLLIAR